MASKLLEQESNIMPSMSSSVSFAVEENVLSSPDTSDAVFNSNSRYFVIAERKTIAGSLLSGVVRSNNYDINKGVNGWLQTTVMPKKCDIFINFFSTIIASI